MSAAAEKLPNKAEPLNIYQRINEVRKKVWYVQKDKEVSTGGGKYKAATHDTVTAMVRNHLIEHGILIVPRLQGSFVTDIGQTKSGTPMIRYSARFEIDFVNCDNPSDHIAVPAESHANDTGDKAPGKAVSYATKYAVLKLFNIETGEDEESRVEPYGGALRITAEQVQELESLLIEAEADKDAFLKWIKAESLEDIYAKAFDQCKRQLQAKIEGNQKRKAAREKAE